MIRRLIVRIRWYREFLETFPTRESFLEANDLRVNREREVLTAVADHNFKRGYRQAREDGVNATQKWLWVDLGNIH
jgi:hypothetical protein